MVTFYILSSVVLTCRKFCCWWQNILFSIDTSWKLLILFLKTVYQIIYLLLHPYLFCIKQANKICTLLSSHFWVVLCFWRQVLYFEVTHPNTIPTWHGNFTERLSYKATGAQSACSKLWSKRSCKGTWSTCQPWSQCFSILLFPSIFLWF